MRVFIGYDARQPVAFNVLAHSIMSRASKPVSITRLDISQLPITRQGLTEFTFTRYLVPYLCNYEGVALFLDADMLCLTDINDLNLSEDQFQGNSVAVVKEGVERFEWPSMMLFNNPLCKSLTPEFIEQGAPQKLEWGKVASLPKDYNHIVPYSGKNPNAKIVHFTQGIPCFKETEDCEYSKQWRDELKESVSSCTWQDIMGKSVHKERMIKSA